MRVYAIRGVAFNEVYTRHGSRCQHFSGMVLAESAQQAIEIALGKFVGSIRIDSIVDQGRELNDVVSELENRK